ncbi:cytadherence high molecular weight protein 2 [Candidatus Phytoplasma australiense]|nr:cytadherence high molecular weight protein 2 [Candidatus Phytoplasma australiense]
MFFYNKLISLFKKKQEENDFFALFLEEFEKMIIDIKNVPIASWTNNNLPIFKNEYELNKRGIQEKYFQTCTILNKKIQNLLEQRRLILEKKSLKEAKIQDFFNKEVILQKNKNTNQTHYLIKNFHKEIEYKKNRNQKKKIFFLSRLNDTTNHLNNLLIHLEQQKKQAEKKKNVDNELLKKNFYTTDFKLNQKNKNLKQQLDSELKDLETEKINILSQFAKIYHYKMDLYQKNINKSNNIYQIKLDNHNKFFDVIKDNYEKNKIKHQTQKESFFRLERSIPFLNVPFNFAFQKRKNALYAEKLKNELSYLQEITLWKKKYNFINMNHHKTINYLNLEKEKQNEIYQKYRKNVIQKYQEQEQKTKNLFAQKINDVKLQIQVIRNLHLRDIAVWENEKDYQETFFSYRKAILTLKLKKNLLQKNYYFDFFHNKAVFGFKNKSIILQLKLEKIRNSFYDFIKIVELKKEISFLENQRHNYQLLQQDNLHLHQLQEEKKKNFFLKDISLHKTDINQLWQKQFFEKTQLLSSLSNSLEQTQKTNNHNILILKTLKQKITSFQKLFHNKMCLLEENTLNYFQKVIQKDFMKVAANQFKNFCLLHEKKYLFQEQQIKDKIQMIEQMILFSEKQLSFISEKLDKNFQILTDRKKTTPLEQIYHQINFQKKKLSQQSDYLKKKTIKMQKDYEQKRSQYNPQYQKKIHEIKELQQKLFFFWQCCNFEPQTKQIHPLSIVKKKSSAAFFHIWQKTFKKSLQVIWVYYCYQKSFIKRNSLFVDSEKQKLAQNKETKAILLQQDKLTNNILEVLDPFVEKIFFQKEKELFQEIRKKQLQKQKELKQSSQLVKQKITLLNENLKDVLNNLKDSWQNQQKELKNQLLFLEKKDFFQPYQKKQVFLENKKKHIKNKNNLIFKNFALNKKNIFKIFYQKKREIQKKIVKIDQKLKVNQFCWQRIKTSSWKEKFKKIRSKFSLLWKKYKKTREINSRYQKIKKEIKQKIQFEKSIS